MEIDLWTKTYNNDSIFNVAICSRLLQNFFNIAAFLISKMEILQSIDFYKCGCVNIDKKNLPNSVVVAVLQLIIGYVEVPDRDSVSKVIKFYINNDLTPKCTIDFYSPSELESYSSSTTFSFASGTISATNFKSLNNFH
ncbi:hypothetical protein ACTFIY_010728 [Dictyostelium cf. discoideum]